MQDIPGQNIFDSFPELSDIIRPSKRADVLLRSATLDLQRIRRKFNNLSQSIRNLGPMRKKWVSATYRGVSEFRPNYVPGQ